LLDKFLLWVWGSFEKNSSGEGGCCYSQNLFYFMCLLLPAARFGLGTAVARLNGAKQPFADTWTVSE